MNKQKQKPALERLEELRTKVRDAEQRVQEVELERSKARRSVDRVKGPLLSYYQELGAGKREADAKLEQDLLAKVREAEGRVTMRPVWRGGTAVVGLEPVDELVEAKLAGAKEAQVEAEGAVANFISSHRHELVEELTPRAEAARDRLLEAIDALAAAEGAWMAERRTWGAFIERWGVSPAELPRSPIGGLLGEVGQALAPLVGGEPRDPRRLLPMPSSLAPGPGAPDPVDADADDLARVA